MFLSRTSRLVSEKAARSPSLDGGWLLRLPQVFLAALCLAIGLAPALGITLVQRGLNASQQGLGLVLARHHPWRWRIGPASSGPRGRGLCPLALAGVTALIFLVVRAVAKSGAARRRAAAPWLCGYAREADAHRYRANGLYGEIKRYFGWLAGRREKISSPRTTLMITPIERSRIVMECRDGHSSANRPADREFWTAAARCRFPGRRTRSKAAAGCRSPRRYRVAGARRGFMGQRLSMHVKQHARCHGGT